MLAWRISISLIIATTGFALHASGDGTGFVTIDGTNVIPESIAADRRGALYIGSMAQGTIYRALPRTGRAKVWLDPRSTGIQHAMGVQVDESNRRLLVCASSLDASGVSTGSLRGFDLDSRRAVADYRLEAGGQCNDLAIGDEGTIYATDFDNGRIMRLLPGDTLLREWVRSPLLAGANGIALLGTNLYVTSYTSGRLVRISPVGKDRTAEVVEISLDGALAKPDALRAVGARRLLLVEGAGRLLEIVVSEPLVRLRIVCEGLRDDPAGVAIVGNIAWIVAGRFASLKQPDLNPRPFRAIAVPYAPESR